MEKNTNKDTDKRKDGETNNLESDDKYEGQIKKNSFVSANALKSQRIGRYAELYFLLLFFYEKNQGR